MFMCGALLVNYCAVVRFFHFFVPSFMRILDLSAISLQEIFVSPFINAMIILHSAANYKMEMLRRSQ